MPTLSVTCSGTIKQVASIASLQCFDTVGWATGRASGL